jgi:hypothetical protein
MDRAFQTQVQKAGRDSQQVHHEIRQARNAFDEVKIEGVRINQEPCRNYYTENFRLRLLFSKLLEAVNGEKKTGEKANQRIVVYRIGKLRDDDHHQKQNDEYFEKYFVIHSFELRKAGVAPAFQF